MNNAKIYRDFLLLNFNLKGFLLWLFFFLTVSLSVKAQNEVLFAEEDSIVVEEMRLDVSLLDENVDTMRIEQLRDTMKNAILMPFFRPSPTTAVWRAAIFPGLGQIYNRKYWKLPIVYGGFMALTYAVSWNGKYYREYSVAYRDLMDNNPETNSYLNFLRPGVSESTYSKEWLQKTFKRKNDYYRRNRDLSIIGMLGVYLVSILDAYVDAQLYDFDISPDLSFHIEPTVIPRTHISNDMVGVRCSFNF